MLNSQIHPEYIKIDGKTTVILKQLEKMDATNQAILAELIQISAILENTKSKKTKSKHSPKLEV